MGSHRRTIAAAIATSLASLSLYPIFYGFAWFWAGVGATLTIALVGTLTRLRRLPVLVCVLAALAGLLLLPERRVRGRQVVALRGAESDLAAPAVGLGGNGFQRVVQVRSAGAGTVRHDAARRRGHRA